MLDLFFFSFSVPHYRLLHLERRIFKNRQSGINSATIAAPLAPPQEGTCTLLKKISSTAKPAGCIGDICLAFKNTFQSAGKIC
jgi:hypothetical protein